MLVIISLSFFIMRAAPGGPFSTEKKIPPQILENIEKKYHMNDPLMVQFGNYLLDLLQGDLGPSFKSKDFTVNQLIFGTADGSGSRLWTSFYLGTLSLFLALGAGLMAGITSALKKNTWGDYLSMSFAIIGISVPLFVIGPLLQQVFGLNLKWLPIAGWIGDEKWGAWTILLPAITLAMPTFAYIARLSRASILEVLRTDYVRTARAKGLSYPVIVVKHVLKGALLPVVSYLGPAYATIITGSVVVERIFAVPGLGTHFVQSSLNRDYTLIMGTVIVYSLILVIMNFIVDVVYSFLDPRVSYK